MLSDSYHRQGTVQSSNNCFSCFISRFQNGNSLTMVYRVDKYIQSEVLFYYGVLIISENFIGAVLFFLQSMIKIENKDDNSFHCM